MRATDYVGRKLECQLCVMRTISYIVYINSTLIYVSRHSCLRQKLHAIIIIIISLAGCEVCHFVCSVTSFKLTSNRLNYAIMRHRMNVADKRQQLQTHHVAVP